MFELVLAETHDESNGAFWALIDLFHIFNHYNPSGIMDFYNFLVIYLFIGYVIGMDALNYSYVINCIKTRLNHNRTQLLYWHK